MIDPEEAPSIDQVLRDVVFYIRRALKAINEYDFKLGLYLTGQAIAIAKHRLDIDNEEHLNRLFVIRAYIKFFDAYASAWDSIINGDYKESWNSLQDAIDMFQLVRRFEGPSLEAFGSQLAELEKAYPYRIFASIGAIAKKIECSICHNDIDSEECYHRRGQLYRGEMAVAIIRESTLDHVALVTNPEDRRCVITFDNSAPQFRLLEALSTYITQQKCSILDFSEVVFSKRKKSLAEIPRTGRNDRCPCGSGRKFKKCCQERGFIDSDHVEFVFTPRGVDDFVRLPDG